MKRKRKAEQVFSGSHSPRMTEEELPYRGEATLSSPQELRKVRLLKKVREEGPI